MENCDKYVPQQIEDKWYEYWIENNFFHSEPDEREPYTIVIPPPNVTGMLHMGHMLNNTLQDVLVRRARMSGKNACWVPGTDHASIATEAKVVARLKAQGIDKSSLTREEFLQHAWQWKEEFGGVILRQLRKLGASCDWERTCFTMDEERSKSVIKVFVDLFNKGKIYRGVRMVHWDPAAQTALSDEEVIYRESQGKLYYLRYQVEGEEGRYIIVATTRPETILGDTALCVNPNDPRYTDLEGKRVIVPLVGRSVPVIRDEYVDIEFGTGALKVTPAHDVNDYMLGEKYGLESIDIFNPDGTINDRVGMYVGMDRFVLRDQIEKDLAEAGLLEKTEAYTNNVGYSERTNVPIEPKLSMQWFLRMEELAKPALEVVMNDSIRFVPAKFKNTYRHWMENIKDWCISRQLWWGHRIPAYFLPAGGYVVAETAEEALELARAKSGNNELQMSDLRQDDDVLDTWFSSWLWPMSVFGGVTDPDNKEINYYYPTNDLVTGPDIIFFWVARMIMAGEEYRNEVPFRNVYFTGIVRDKIGRKMSKQLGNSPDPLDLIATYGADGVRAAMLLSTSAGNDIMFDEALCEQGRNFGNKIWNAFKLIEGWKVDDTLAQSENNRLSVEWFDALLSRTLAEIDDHFEAYRISDAMMTAYKLFWDDFSGWYLEMVKPAYGSPIDRATIEATRTFFDKLLRTLHPFIPFVTEELWQRVLPRKAGESITVAYRAVAGEQKPELLARMELVQEAVTAVRNVRKQSNTPQKEALELRVIADENYPAELVAVLSKMANLSSVTVVEEKDPTAQAFIVKTTQYFVPMSESIDVEAELEKLAADEKYYEGFLRTV
ncbi:MAG: valine--tRNA ligase, partial [Tidjanibacter sp.]|nr:valine--tRNA ligase [Tidjanibacter sp.]